MLKTSAIFRQAGRLNRIRYSRETARLEPKLLDSAIVGMLDMGSGFKVVYDYYALVKAFRRANKWDEQTAMEWVDFNTVRALPYMDTDEVVGPMITYGGSVHARR